MERHLRTARMLAKLLDSQYSIFGIRFGLDPIINLVPGLGDVAGLFLSLYIVWVSLRFKLPRNKIRLMIRNIIIDFLAGLLPVIGTVFDITFRSNERNIKILNDTLEKGVVY